MKLGFIVPVLAALLCGISCQTTESGSGAQTGAGKQPKKAQEAFFDVNNVPKELHDTTLAEVQALIKELNTIIQKKDYEGWLKHLSESYLAKINSPEFLRKTSQSPKLSGQKIILKSTRDYFLYVVVPSRANEHAEEIKFISRTRVKALAQGKSGEWLLLYELDKGGGYSWKISD